MCFFFLIFLGYHYTMFCFQLKGKGEKEGNIKIKIKEKGNCFNIFSEVLF